MFLAGRVVSTIVNVDYYVNGFTVCISNDKTVHSFGKHSNGAHGHAKERIFSPKIIPLLTNIKSIACGNKHSVCLDFDGNVFTFGSNSVGQLGVGKESKDFESSCEPLKVELPSIKQISCGSHFTVCLSDEGFLFFFGNLWALGAIFSSPKDLWAQIL